MVLPLIQQTQTKPVTEASHRESFMGSSDFSSKTLTLLQKKGVSVVSSVAIPDFDGDKYFSGVAYNLNDNGNMIVRRHWQVLAMANSSWKSDFAITEGA